MSNKQLWVLQTHPAGAKAYIWLPAFDGKTEGNGHCFYGTEEQSRQYFKGDLAHDNFRIKEYVLPDKFEKEISDLRSRNHKLTTDYAHACGEPGPDDWM